MEIKYGTGTRVLALADCLRPQTLAPQQLQ